MGKVVSTVFCDIGGVVSQHRELVADACKIFGVSDHKAFLGHLHARFAPASRGVITLKEALYGLTVEFGKVETFPVLFELWTTEFSKKVVRDEEVIGILSALRTAGLKLCAVSDTVPEHAKIHRGRGDYDVFHELVLSYEVGFAKADVQVFELALARMNCRPDEAIFIDDVESLVARACSIGIDGILFTDAQTLREDLRERGLSA